MLCHIDHRVMITSDGVVVEELMTVEVMVMKVVVVAMTVDSGDGSGVGGRNDYSGGGRRSDYSGGGGRSDYSRGNGNGRNDLGSSVSHPSAISLC